MKRRLILSLLAVFAVLLMDVRLAPVLAAESDCWKNKGDAAVRACTQIIDSKRLYNKPISQKNLAIIYVNRAIAYENAGQLNKAAQDYGAASKIDAGNKKAIENLLRILPVVKQNHYDKYSKDCLGKTGPDRKIQACTDLLILPELNTKVRYAAHKLRSIAYFEKKNWDNAITDSTRAIKLDPAPAEPYYVRGWSRFNKCMANLMATFNCNYKPIADDFSFWLIFNPKDKETLKHRALVYFALHQKDKAIADCNRITQLDPAMGAKCIKDVQ